MNFFTNLNLLSDFFLKYYPGSNIFTQRRQHFGNAERLLPNTPGIQTKTTLVFTRVSCCLLLYRV